MTDPTPAADTHATDSRALTLNLVLAQVAQNVLGGLGAGVVVATCLWLAHVPLETAWRWPAGIAIIVAGGSTLWRAYLDEFRAGRRWNEREALHREEMLAVCADLDEIEDERDRLLADAAALRSRLAWLEQRLNQPMRINGVPQEPTDDPAHKDAVALIHKRYGQGVAVTARHMMSVGWPQARYSAALDVLKAAGVVEVNGTRTTWGDYQSPEAALYGLYTATPIVLNGNTDTDGQGGV